MIYNTLCTGLECWCFRGQHTHAHTCNGVDDKGGVVMESILLQLEFVDTAKSILVQESLDRLNHVLLGLLHKTHTHM